METLSFLGDIPHSPFHDLNAISHGLLSWSLIPEAPGAYVYRTTEKQFSYPLGTTQVYYIGKADDLRRRQKKDRMKWVKTITRKREEGLPHDRVPVTYYAIDYGIHISYVLLMDVDIKQHPTPEALEAHLIHLFTGMYGSKPSANRK